MEKGLYRAGLRSPGNLALPDFLVLGAPRCGTTWLHENLSHCPEVFLATSEKAADPTEVLYFNKFFEEPLTHYSAHFAEAGSRVKGDKSPNYLFIDSRRIRFVHAIMPSVRLVVLLRNPIERAWSHARMRLGPRSTDLAPDDRLASYRSYFERTAYRGLYSRAIDRWLSVFPEEQLLIGFFEQIADEPKQLLERIFDHIGVPAPAAWDDLPYRSRINPAASEQIPAAYHRMLVGIYREEIDELADRFGDRVARWRADLA